MDKARAHVSAEIKAELEKHKYMLGLAAKIENPDYRPSMQVPDQNIARISAPNMQLGSLPRRPTETFVDARKRRQMIQDFDQITARIAKVADPKRDEADIWQAVHGSKATRA